jgi:hypothetical protein
MAREEASLLPMLVAHLCVAEQRTMVWGTLQAMPLRLLERVLPWLAGGLSYLPQSQCQDEWYHMHVFWCIACSHVGVVF